MPVHNDYLEKGYSCKMVIRNDGLDLGLAEVAVRAARGEYGQLLIVPGEIALAGSDFEFKDPSHVVYAKKGKRERRTIRASVILPTLRNRTTRELTGMINLTAKL